MSIVDGKSLLRTLDNLDAAAMSGRSLTKRQRDEAAAFIASRLGNRADGRFVAGSYRGMPAPTELDYRRKGKLFTGEIINSNAGMGCKIGFEATRALVLLDSRTHKEATQAALRSAGQLIDPRHGMYCCTSCSPSMWRLLATGAPRNAAAAARAGIAKLAAARQPNGRWRSFPFWYTLLAVSELPGAVSGKELAFAAAVCERLLRRATPDSPGPYVARRRSLAQRVLQAQA